MRCNCGIDPKLLADQHLLAEARELGMVAGSLKANGFEVKSPIPDQLNLGKGHINFFKNKLIYLQRRWIEVVKECSQRNFNIQKPFHNLFEFPEQYKGDWSPTLRDSWILRQRVIERLGQGNRRNWYRYYGEVIDHEHMGEFQQKLLLSPLYFV